MDDAEPGYLLVGRRTVAIYAMSRNPPRWRIVCLLFRSGSDMM